MHNAHWGANTQIHKITWLYNSYIYILNNILNLCLNSFTSFNFNSLSYIKIFSTGIECSHTRHRSMVTIKNFFSLLEDRFHGAWLAGNSDFFFFYIITVECSVISRRQDNVSHYRHRKFMTWVLEDEFLIFLTRAWSNSKVDFQHRIYVSMAVSFKKIFLKTKC